MTTLYTPVNRTPCAPAEVTRSVAAAQMVFTVGNVLTTGGFLYYFANALNPSALLLSVLLVTPEVSETISVLSRSVVSRFGSRKRTWLIGYILARIAALGIPVVALFDLGVSDTIAYWILIASLAASHAFQAVAYTAYISWLSDLVPSNNWGEFFALRRIANVATLVVVPAVAALLRRDWSDWQNDGDVRAAYVTLFLVGNILLWLAMPPLMRLPDIAIRWQNDNARDWRSAVKTLVDSRPLRLIIASSLWLAFFQGLTQSAFFYWQVRVLKLPLEAYLLLSGLMYLLQIPASWLGGYLSDRYGDRRPLVVALFMVSGSMAFWLLAQPSSPHWLVGAYVLWGLFGLINVCQRNLLLRHAPPSDNTLPISFLKHVAGFIAGLAGLLGGWTLDSLLATFEMTPLAYATLFVVSWIGRATAPLWLIPIPDTPRNNDPDSSTD